MEQQNLSFDALPKAVQQLQETVECIKTLLLESNSKPEDTSEQLLTVQQAAKFLSLSVPTIYSKISKGELPNMKRGKRVYFSQPELIAYLKEGRNKTNNEIQAEANTYLTGKNR